MEYRIELKGNANGYSYKRVYFGDKEMDVDKSDLKDWIELEFMDKVHELQYDNAENTDYGLSDAIEELTDRYYDDNDKIIEYVKEKANGI